MLPCLPGLVNETLLTLEYLFQDYVLFQVEHGESVSNGTDNCVAIFGEIQIPLTINCSEKIGKLEQIHSGFTFYTITSV